MPRSMSHAVIAASSAAMSTLAGIVGGFLANTWSWAVAAAALTLIAVFVGLEGLKAIVNGRAARQAPDPGWPPTPSAATPPSIRMKNSIVAGSIGSVDLSRRTHVHVGGLAAVIGAALLLLLAAGGTVKLAVGDGGRLSDDGAPAADEPVRYTAVFEQAAGPPWLALHGLTDEQYRQKFDELSGQGFHLIHLGGYALANQERFIAIWQQGDGPPLRPAHGLLKQYQPVFDQMTTDGFRLVEFSGHEVAGEGHYTALFAKVNGPAWQSYHTLTAAQYQQTSADLAGQGFRLTQLNGFSVGGAELFTPIYEQRDGAPLRAVYGLSAQQYQTTFDEFAAQRFRLTQLNGYPSAHGPRFAALFEQRSGPPLRAYYDLTAAQYQRKFNELSEQGYRLVQFGGYPAD